MGSPHTFFVFVKLIGDGYRNRSIIRSDPPDSGHEPQLAVPHRSESPLNRSYLHKKIPQQLAEESCGGETLRVD